MIATNITDITSRSTSEKRMGGTVANTVLPFQRHRRVSPYLRLAEELGYAKEKTARDNVGRPYLQVAITNRVLLEAGQSEKVGELMAVIEASLMGQPEPLEEARYKAGCADVAEDRAEIEFIKNAGDTELDAWIKKLADELYQGEKLLTALITERDKRRGEK